MKILGLKKLDISHKSLVTYHSKLVAQFPSTKMAKNSPRTTYAIMLSQTSTTIPFTMKGQLHQNAKLAQIQIIRLCAAKVRNTMIPYSSIIDAKLGETKNFIAKHLIRTMDQSISSYEILLIVKIGVKLLTVNKN